MQDHTVDLYVKLALLIEGRGCVNLARWTGMRDSLNLFLLFLPYTVDHTNYNNQCSDVSDNVTLVGTKAIVT